MPCQLGQTIGPIPGRQICPPWVWPANTKSKSFRGRAPTELVGRMRQQDSECLCPIACQPRGEWIGQGKPRQFVAGQENALAVDFRSTGGQQPDRAQPASDRARNRATSFTLLVMVSQYKILAQRGFQLAEDRTDPIDSRRRVANVTGNGQQIGLQAVGDPHDFFRSSHA